MEKLKDLDSRINELRAIAPDAADYLQLFLEDVSFFDLEEYQDSPCLVAHSLPNIDEDQNELIILIDDAFPEEVDRGELVESISGIAEVLMNKPVCLWAIKPILEHLAIKLEASNSEEDSVNRPIRFRVPNLIFDRRELERFLRACDLTQVIDEGSGSHAKWVDSSGNLIAMSSGSKKMWLKNDIKTMIGNGFPVEKIKAACASLGIDFRVIKQ